MLFLCLFHCYLPQSTSFLGLEGRNLCWSAAPAHYSPLWEGGSWRRQTQCVFYAPEVLWAFPWHPELTAGAAAGHKLVAEGFCALAGSSTWSDSSRQCWWLVHAVTWAETGIVNLGICSILCSLPSFYCLHYGRKLLVAGVNHTVQGQGIVPSVMFPPEHQDEAFGSKEGLQPLQWGCIEESSLVQVLGNGHWGELVSLLFIRSWGKTLQPGSLEHSIASCVPGESPQLSDLYCHPACDHTLEIVKR